MSINKVVLLMLFACNSALAQYPIQNTFKKGYFEYIDINMINIHKDSIFFKQIKSFKIHKYNSDILPVDIGKCFYSKNGLVSKITYHHNIDSFIYDSNSNIIQIRRFDNLDKRIVEQYEFNYNRNNRVKEVGLRNRRGEIAKKHIYFYEDNVLKKIDLINGYDKTNLSSYNYVYSLGGELVKRTIDYGKHEVEELYEDGLLVSSVKVESIQNTVEDVSSYLYDGNKELLFEARASFYLYEFQTYVSHKYRDGRLMESLYSNKEFEKEKKLEYFYNEIGDQSYIMEVAYKEMDTIYYDNNLKYFEGSQSKGVEEVELIKLKILGNTINYPREKGEGYVLEVDMESFFLMDTIKIDKRFEIISFEIYFYCLNGDFGCNQKGNVLNQCALKLLQSNRFNWKEKECHIFINNLNIRDKDTDRLINMPYVKITPALPDLQSGSE